jgi:serine/threonine protein kinase
MKRKTMKRKTMKRNMKRKTMKRKTMKRNMKHKTMKRNLKRKTMKRKTMKRNMKRKTMKRNMKRNMKRKTMKSSNKYVKRLKKIIKYGGSIVEEEFYNYSKADLIKYINEITHIVNTFVVFYKNENDIDLYTVSFQYPPGHILHRTHPEPISNKMRYRQFDQLRQDIHKVVNGRREKDFYKTIFADKVNTRSDFWPKKHYDIKQSTKQKHIKNREKKLTAFLRRMLHGVGGVEGDPDISDNVKKLIYDSIIINSGQVANSTWERRIETNASSDVYASNYLNALKKFEDFEFLIYPGFDMEYKEEYENVIDLLIEEFYDKNKTNELGRGVGGIVYKYTDGVEEDVDKCVKLNRVSFSSLDPGNSKQTYENELTIMKKITDIAPNYDNVKTVNLLGCFYTIHKQDPETKLCFTIMDRIHGLSLEDYIYKPGVPQLTDNDRVTIAVSMFNSLKMLIENGISHNDLKPDNIMVSDIGGEKKSVLIDFGEGRFISEDGSLDTTLPDTQGSNEYDFSQFKNYYHDLNSFSLILFDLFIIKVRTNFVKILKDDRKTVNNDEIIEFLGQNTKWIVEDTNIKEIITELIITICNKDFRITLNEVKEFMLTLEPSINRLSTLVQ